MCFKKLPFDAIPRNYDHNNLEANFNMPFQAIGMPELGWDAEYSIDPISTSFLGSSAATHSTIFISMLSNLMGTAISISNAPPPDAALVDSPVNCRRCGEEAQECAGCSDEEVEEELCLYCAESDLCWKCREEGVVESAEGAAEAIPALTESDDSDDEEEELRNM